MIFLYINGFPYQVEIGPKTTMLEVLRDERNSFRLVFKNHNPNHEKHSQRSSPQTPSPRFPTRRPTSRSPVGFPVPASHRHAPGWQAGEVFSVVRPEMSKEMERRVRNTKVTKAHEIHERKSCRQADFRAFRGLSQLS